MPVTMVNPAPALPPEGAAKSLYEPLHLSEADFEFIAKNIQQRAGIFLAAVKKPMVTRRVASRLRECGLKSFDQYRRLLENPSGKEWLHLVNVLTTNHSAFFREIHHFKLLAELMQEWASEKLEANGSLDIWSAACATGEEPYSIGMTLTHYLPERLLSRVNILASDIDSDALEAAQVGKYPSSRVQNIPKFARDMFQETASGTISIDKAAKRMVTFRQHNLMSTDWSEIGMHDIIFCRNALIYFSADDQRKVIERLIKHVKQGGYLFLGHSETVPLETKGLRRTGVPTAYIRLPD